MPYRTPVIVFSDLDGTLLDHETYSFDPARPALDALRAKAIPLVLASSKTAAEMTIIRDAIGSTGFPAIVENGAGILPPKGEAETAAAPPTREKLLETLKTLPDDLLRHFQGWSAMTTRQIANLTGLPPDDVARAADRQFSEPGTWTGSADDLQRFLAALSEKGIEARQGGRFLTLSFGSDKAKRMDEIRQALFGPNAKVLTVALGDAPNDIGMLQMADIGVVIANPAHDALPDIKAKTEGAIIRTEKAGPEGWNEAVLWILSKVDAATHQS